MSEEIYEDLVETYYNASQTYIDVYMELGMQIGAKILSQLLSK